MNTVKRFSVKRLMITIAFLGMWFSLVAYLAGLNQNYEETAILYISAPADWPEDRPLPSTLTDEDFHEHARRLVSPRVLDQAAQLLNSRSVATDETFRSSMARFGVPIPRSDRVVGRGFTSMKSHPTYSGSKLRRCLRTKMVRYPGPMSSDLVDNAVILFATAKSQGEAKDIALAVVDVYSEIATAERVSGSANLGYIVEKPWLDRPWKIILASVLGLSLAGALILMRADKAPGR